MSKLVTCHVCKTVIAVTDADFNENEEEKFTCKDCRMVLKNGRIPK